jgi:hypothetical protein
MDNDNKLNNCLKITGIINSVFRPKKILKKIRIKLNNTLAIPRLLYANENWTIKAREVTRITAAGMKYMRRTAGFIWTPPKSLRTSVKAIPSLWVQLPDIQPTKVLFVKDKLPDWSVFPPVSVALV